VEGSLRALLLSAARMPQVLKEGVRERILAAALEVFARDGFVSATMASIAARAERGAATIYSY